MGVGSVWDASRRGAGRFRRRGVKSAVVVTAIALLLSFYGALRLAGDQVRRAAASSPRGLAIVAYLDEAVDRDEAEGLRRALEALAVVETVRYVAPDASFERMKQELADESLWVGVEPGLLPASLEIELSPGIESAAAARPLLTRLAASDAIADVDDGEDRGEVRDGGVLRALDDAMAFSAWAVGGMAAVLIAVVVAGVGGRWRREGQFAALFGASALERRLPAVFEALLFGILGASVAHLLLGLLLSAALPLVRLARRLALRRGRALAHRVRECSSLRPRRRLRGVRRFLGIWFAPPPWLELRASLSILSGSISRPRAVVVLGLRVPPNPAFAPLPSPECRRRIGCFGMRGSPCGEIVAVSGHGERLGVWCWRPRRRCLSLPPAPRPRKAPSRARLRLGSRSSAPPKPYWKASSRSARASGGGEYAPATASSALPAECSRVRGDGWLSGSSSAAIATKSLF